MELNLLSLLGRRSVLPLDLPPVLMGLPPLPTPPDDAELDILVLSLREPDELPVVLYPPPLPPPLLAPPPHPPPTEVADVPYPELPLRCS